MIKVVSHERPRREMFDVETNHGKRTLVVELETAEGKQRLRELLAVADVLIDGFTFGSLAKHGFAIADVPAPACHTHAARGGGGIMPWQKRAPRPRPQPTLVK